MQFDEAPLTAEESRIHRVLEQEIPTRSRVYMVPLFLGCLISALSLSAVSVGTVWAVASARGAEFRLTWIPVILVLAYLLALVVGRFAPRPDFRDSGKSWGKKDSNLSGCLGAAYQLLAGNLYQTTVFVVFRPALKHSELEMATTLVRACLAHPGAERGRIVRAVAKASPIYTQTDVERVLRELRRRGIVGGTEFLRIPPSRARDFGAAELI